MTDDAAYAALEADLIEWGLLERGPDGLAWTRRLRGAVMREAARLAEEERAGHKPDGAPLFNAVAGAVAGLAVPATPAHARFLFAVELASLPETVRGLVGA
jgi:DNA-binding IclR family transcriptional regulator